MLRMALALLVVVPAAVPATPSKFLFSYFTGNGEDGLHFAESADGLTWAAVAGGRSFLTPAVGSKLMRDPSIARGSDGVFHLVWTTGGTRASVSRTPRISSSGRNSGSCR